EENRTLRSKRRGLETWHGRNAGTLATERASNRESKPRPTPARQSSTLPAQDAAATVTRWLGLIVTSNWKTAGGTFNKRGCGHRPRDTPSMTRSEHDFDPPRTSS